MFFKPLLPNKSFFIWREVVSEGPRQLLSNVYVRKVVSVGQSPSKLYLTIQWPQSNIHNLRIQLSFGRSFFFNSLVVNLNLSPLILIIESTIFVL